MLPTLFKNMTLYWLWIVCWIIENLSTDTYSFIHCKIYTVNDKYVMKTEEKMDTNVDFIEMSIKDDALHQAVKDLHSRLLKAIKWTFLDALFIC